MSRKFIFGILLILSIAASSPAAAPVTFSESFNGPTLDPQLYVTTSSSAYSLNQLAPGSTWQMSKQAGTTTGAVEIHTNFKVSGNFTVDVNGSPLKHELAGRVNGSSIEGSVTLTGNRMQGQYEWNAARGAK